MTYCDHGSERAKDYKTIKEGRKAMNKEKNIVRNGKKLYKEVKLDGTGADRHYRNPLTKVFQYEYALYEAVSELFASVECSSMCIDSLKLYFKEMPHAQEQSVGDKKEHPKNEKKKKTQEGLLEEMTSMVTRDVVGHITFPMITICQAEVRVDTEKDGTHTFIFGDGIYGFSIHLDMPPKGRPKRIEVQDLSSIQPVDGNRKDAALECVA